MILPKSKKTKILEAELKYKETELKRISVKLERENKVLKVTNKIINQIDAKMQSYKSFPAEFYPDGIKQGPYSGLGSYNSPDKTRKLSRYAYNNSSVAQSIVNTFSTLTVGKGLDLEAQPLWRLIKEVNSWSDDRKKEWIKYAEARYNQWAKRKDISYNEAYNRYQQEQINIIRLLVDGEYFEIYRYASNTNKNPLTIQLIKAEDVRTPTGSKVAEGNSEENGIEYNSKNIPVAYHIYDYNLQKTVRILRKGPRSGRIFVNHEKLGDNRRGVSIIATMTTDVVKLEDYKVLELQSAIVNALYAVWVKTPEGSDGVPTINAGLGDDSQPGIQTEKTYEEWIQDRKNLDYTQGGLQLDTLPGGYSVESFDTKRPNVNFGTFFDQVKKNLASSRGVAVSVVDQDFKKNYSASRGELMLTWYEIEKMLFNQSMNNELVYRMWLWGEVTRGKIEAPGFLTNEESEYAWSNSKWIGNQRPDIDPLKSVQAHMHEQNRGYKTGKQITAERGGGDYDENLVRAGSELKKVAANQIPFQSVDVDLEDQ